jgi:hypothetical protein
VNLRELNKILRKEWKTPENKEEKDFLKKASKAPKNKKYFSDEALSFLKICSEAASRL